MTLPILYKLTKTLAIQTYQVSTSLDTITVTQGQLTGKKQSYLTKCTGKNTGKSNATTGSQQADLEAKSKHQKKLDSGYTLDPSGKLTVKLPMKVKVYQDQLKNVKFPCIVMTKLNGINGEYRLEDDVLTLYSRGGNIYPPIPHLESEVRELLSVLNTTSLNGELYIHGEYLEDITSAVKKPKALSTRLEFRVFALPASGLTFKEVANTLNRTISQQFVKPCRSVLADSHSLLSAYRTKAVCLGFEGLVIYNPNGTYQYNTRSSDAFKYKPTQDGEFEVINFKLDKLGHAVYECTTPQGKPFSVKRKGTAEARLADAAIASSNIGKYLTVEYEVLSKELKPLKPVGLDFRLVDANGNPLE